MRFELTHDIIAQKIWEQLPEHDKQLQLARSSLLRRFKDYKKERGSLLGKKEIESWNYYFPLMDLNEEQKLYVRKSHLAKRKARNTKRTAILFLIILTISSLVTAFIAVKNLELARQKEKEAASHLEKYKEEQKEKKLANYNRYLEVGKNAVREEDFVRAIDLFNLALSFQDEGKEALGLIKETEFKQKTQNQFNSLLKLAKDSFTNQNFLKARDYFEKALKLRPNNQAAIIGRSNNEEKLRGLFNELMEKAKVYYGTGNRIGYEDALRSYIKALEIKPNDTYLRKQIKECRDKLKGI